MPVILRANGFVVKIYTFDHDPPHVHVFDADGQSIITLGEVTQAPTFREIRRMKPHNAVRALALVREHKLTLLAEWSDVHG